MICRLIRESAEIYFIRRIAALLNYHVGLFSLSNRLLFPFQIMAHWHNIAWRYDWKFIYYPAGEDIVLVPKHMRHWPFNFNVFHVSNFNSIFNLNKQMYKYIIMTTACTCHEHAKQQIFVWSERDCCRNYTTRILSSVAPPKSIHQNSRVTNNFNREPPSSTTMDQIPVSLFIAYLYSLVN